MINPLAPFQYWNTRVHGITQYDVRNAPTFPEYWDNISDKFSDIVVAHNAAFDISCLRSVIEHYGLPKPDFDYYCTLCISKKNLSIDSHKLDSIARYFKLPAFNHHNALDDAVICARIFHRLSNNFDISSFKKHFDAPVMPKKISKTVSISKRTVQNKQRDIAKIVGLRGERVVSADDFFDYSQIDFTKSFRVVGKFSDMTIGQVESLILRQGGSIVESVSAYPDYVVVGAKQSVYTPYGELDEDAYVAKKAGIPVISERHFLSQIC